ncbi:hypothetical protein ASQ49_01700 [Acidipropionibacterium acidipropionici]|nr:hypothetical protein ASQ49_01700 [Acidipropionibacterium acidipropionici]
MPASREIIPAATTSEGERSSLMPVAVRSSIRTSATAVGIAPPTACTKKLATRRRASPWTAMSTRQMAAKAMTTSSTEAP